MHTTAPVSILNPEPQLFLLEPVIVGLWGEMVTMWLLS